MNTHFTFIISASETHKKKNTNFTTLLSNWNCFQYKNDNKVCLRSIASLNNISGQRKTYQLTLCYQNCGHKFAVKFQFIKVRKANWNSFDYAVL